MSFVTETEVLENVPEFAGQSTSDKARLLSQAEAYLIARNVKPYLNPLEVPTPVKQASYEIIKGIIKGELYKGQEQVLKRKKVKADTVESEKEYMDGSVAVSATEQYIHDLLAPYTKRPSVIFLRRL